ncbi:MAG TPA: galactose-1-phosphate uridylyltransferase [Actinomycetota bacterium]|jgi:UDPglucose--hexose-1-phosphate uridylyltransferase
MSTLRQDPTTRQWAILATRRGDRPHEPVVIPRPQLPEHEDTCPFCPGNEDQTPPEILRVPGSDWMVRVVPNMFAALTGAGPAERSGDRMFREMPGLGSHEVVIETPRHDGRMDELDPADVSLVVRVWLERYRTLIASPDVRAVVVFKNFGALAGTSLTHPHSQIVATPVFLPRLLRRLNVASRYYDENGVCVYDDVIAAEQTAADRIVLEQGGFVAFEPWAAQSPFETWIAPTFHQGSFGDLADEHVDDLAEILVRTLTALRGAAGDPDFNLVLYSAPTNGWDSDRVFHWHLKLIPRISTQAGFEIGSAMSINTLAPEDAAEALRAALER